MEKGLSAAAAASSWPAGRGGGFFARCGEKGSAWRGAAEQAKAVGPVCQLGRGSCNTRAPGVHGTCSTLCQSMLEVAVEAGN